MPDTSSQAVAVASGIPAARAARLAKNAIANLLRLGTTWLIVLVVPPLLVRCLDKPSYATWMLILQLGAYATLFDGGLQLAVGRYVAREDPSGDRRSLGVILSSAGILFTALAMLILAAVVLGSLTLGHVFHSIPPALVHPAGMALLLVGGSLALAFPSSVLAGLSLGLEKNQINAVAGGASKLVGAAGTVWAALHHQGLVIMALWTAAGTLVQPVVFVIASRGQGLRSLLRAGLVKASAVWEFARFCSATMASQLGMLLISGLDLPIVVAYDFRNAGYYAVAITASNMLVVPFGAVLTALMPILSNMSLQGTPEQLGNLVLRMTRVSSAMLVLVGVPLMLGMPTLLHLWVGQQYAERSLPFAEFLVAAQIIRLVMSPYALAGFSAGRQQSMLVSPTAESIVNLLLSLLLVRFMGAEGVAIGTFVGAIVGVVLHFLNSMPKSLENIAVSRRSLSQGIIRPLMGAVPTAGVIWMLLKFFSGSSAAVFILCCGTVFLALFLWKGSLRSEDRAQLCTLGGKLLPSRFLRKGILRT